VPVTVLSRCQRFDLRRIEAGRLVALMRDIAGKEKIAVDEAALAMIARAAEGSARDALSLLDRAIAHTSGSASAEDVHQMLGLADRAMVIDLFEEIMRGDVAGALTRLKDLHDVGADPAVVLEELAAFTHVVTRLKLAPAAEEDAALTEEERTRGKEFAAKLSVRVLARTWQMLLKGLDETKEAPRPLAAADMVVVRIAHAADLPTPDEALKSIGDGSSNGAARARPSSVSDDQRPRMTMTAGGSRPAAVAQPSPAAAAPAPAAAPRLESFAAVVALAGARRELRLKHALETVVRPVRFQPGQIEVALTEHAEPGLAGMLAKKLEEWTGERWMIVVSREAGEPTVAEVRQTARARLVDDARADPLVSAVLERFPGAEIVDVRAPAGEGAAPEIDPAAAPADDFQNEDE
jgi:DNA polymerase-3 subunit gamma/tau